MPSPKDGDVYTCGDYEYKYYMLDRNGGPVAMPVNYPGDGWKTTVIDTTKKQYGTVLSEVAGEKIERLNGTYENCTNMVIAPSIPTTVKELRFTYYGCTSLVKAPAIPDSVIEMSYCFYGCTSLKTAPVIGPNVKILMWAFADCTSLTGNIVINAVDLDYANDGTVCCFEGVNFTKQKITFSGNKKMIDWLMATGDE